MCSHAQKKSLMGWSRHAPRTYPAEKASVYLCALIVAASANRIFSFSKSSPQYGHMRKSGCTSFPQAGHSTFLDKLVSSFLREVFKEVISDFTQPTTFCNPRKLTTSARTFCSKSLTLFSSIVLLIKPSFIISKKFPFALTRLTSSLFSNCVSLRILLSNMSSGFRSATMHVAPQRAKAAIKEPQKYATTSTEPNQALNGYNLSRVIEPFCVKAKKASNT